MLTGVGSQDNRPKEAPRRAGPSIKLILIFISARGYISAVEKSGSNHAL
jgi:hypothetical protein